MGKKIKREADAEDGSEGQYVKKSKKSKSATVVDGAAEEQKYTEQKKGNKAEQDAGGDGYAAAVHQADGDGYQHGAEDDSNRYRHVSLVSKETQTYLDEIIQHFGTLVDEEEKQLLVSNVLEEIAGKEAQVATDPLCSRHVEKLLACAQPLQLIQFTNSAIAHEGLQGLAASPFGSHVVEKVLVRLDAHHDRMTEEEYAAYGKLLEALTSEVCEQLYSFATDRFATHVARRLLCLLAGRNVMPAQSKQQQQQQQKGGSAASVASALATRVSSGKQVATAAADGSAPPRFPELLQKVLLVLCREDYQGDGMNDMVYGRYSSPFTQSALNAAAGDRKLLGQLIPAVLGANYFVDGAKVGKVLEGVPGETVRAMAFDPTASHVVEVVLQVAPGPILDELITRFLVGHLLELANHASANFVLQAALAAARTDKQVKPQYEELAPHMGSLLQRRRGGVVAALVAACRRAECCQRELCAALAEALTAMPRWAGKTAEAVLAPALLCLDSFVELGNNEPLPAAGDAGAGGGSKADKRQAQQQRLSTLGSSILINVLHFTQGACRQFTDSVAGLGTADAARVGRDPSGSRVIEAFLDGSAPIKVKHRLLKSMCGGFGYVSLSGAGAFLVERAYGWGELDVKEEVVKELVGVEKALENLHWGPALLRRIGAESYKRDAEGWRRHASSSTKTLEAFAQLFGEGSGSKGGAKGGQQQQQKGGKGQQQQAAASKSDVDEFSQLFGGGEGKAEEEGGEGKKGKKKSKKGDKGKGGEEPQQPEGQQQQQAEEGQQQDQAAGTEQKEKKKKSKRSRDEDGEADAPVAGDKAKGKGKKSKA